MLLCRSKQEVDCREVVQQLFGASVLTLGGYFFIRSDPRVATPADKQ